MPKSTHPRCSPQDVFASIMAAENRRFDGFVVLVSHRRVERTLNELIRQGIVVC
jgi:hypothetical protein